MGQVTVDAGAVVGPLEMWRHSLGQGGINSLPLPDRVVKGAARLRPRLVRIFIQEFFQIYPDHGRFDWSKLDPYMDAFARMGTSIVAAITIKPPVLYPRIDHAIWQPTDVREWQAVIGQLVRRYSVEKPIVTHWEIGNEPDIGEAGGSPYLIRDPQAYAEYYTLTTRSIREAFPQARVGGPAMAALLAEPLPGFVRYCRETGTAVDFVSWHLYHSDPGRHAYQVAVARLLCADLPRPTELMVTEWSTLPAAWNRGASTVSVEEQAFDPRRAAMVAAAIIGMHRAGLDASFYYHLWDQVCYPADFEPFFSPPGVANMVHHWNKVPHRLGLFGVSGEARPQFFVYQMLSRLGDKELAVSSDDVNVHALASCGPGRIAVLAANHGLEERRDHVLTLRFAHLRPGTRNLTVYRVDRDRRWDAERLELVPVERRTTSVLAEYTCQVLLPADSVVLVELAEPESEGDDDPDRE